MRSAADHLAVHPHHERRPRAHQRIRQQRHRVGFVQDEDIGVRSGEPPRQRRVSATAPTVPSCARASLARRPRPRARSAGWFQHQRTERGMCARRGTASRARSRCRRGPADSIAEVQHGHPTHRASAVEGRSSFRPANRLERGCGAACRGTARACARVARESTPRGVQRIRAPLPSRTPLALVERPSPCRSTRAGRTRR